jgi:hypothetical protein
MKSLPSSQLFLLLLLIVTLSITSVTAATVNDAVGDDSDSFADSTTVNDTASNNSTDSEELQVESTIHKIESDIVKEQEKVQQVQNAPADPIYAIAVDAAEKANETVREAKEDQDMWKEVLDKLIANSEAWGNASKSEEELKLNATLATMDEGEKLASDREKLDQLRKSIEVGKDNVLVSQIADSILEASNELRDGLKQLNDYTNEYDNTKKEFHGSLTSLQELEKSYHEITEKQSSGVSVDDNKISALESEITTKQGFARAQKDRIVSLNVTMTEQKELIKTLHDHINTIVLTKKPDNRTTPSEHTRTMVSKLNIMEHLVDSMSSNVSDESIQLLKDKDYQNKMNSESSDISNKTKLVHDKMSKAAEEYANATKNVEKEMKNELLARKTYEEAKAVDDSTRHNKILQINNTIANKEMELKLANDKLNGELQGEKAAKDAANAEDMVSDAIKKAEELSFQNEEKDMLTPNVHDEGVLPWENEKNDNKNKASEKIREIVSNLLWSEGHSESAKTASAAIVSAVRSYSGMSNEVKTQEAKNVPTKTDKEININSIHETKHLDEKINSIKQTENKEKENKAIDQANEEATKREEGVGSATTAARFQRIQSRVEQTTPKVKPSIYTSVQSTGIAEVNSGIATKNTDSNHGNDLALESVPDTCFDGLKDGKEEGVDCGGDCHRRCGFLTVRSKEHSSSDRNTYHSISYVQRAQDETSELQKNTEKIKPIMVKKLPESVVKRANIISKEHAKDAASTTFESIEDGSDRLVPGQWDEVASLIENKNQHRHLRSRRHRKSPILNAVKDN